MYYLLTRTPRPRGADCGVYSLLNSAGTHHADPACVLRLMLSIDGQNRITPVSATSGTLRHPHPLLDDELLQGPRVGRVRLYTGIHDPRIKPGRTRPSPARLEAMRNRACGFSRARSSTRSRRSWTRRATV